MARHLVNNGAGGGRRVLRIGREDKDATGAATVHLVEDRADGGLPVAHGVAHLDALPQLFLHEFRLAARPVHEGRSFIQPDGAVFFGGLAGADSQDDSFEDGTPDQGVRFDDSAVGEEFAEEGAHVG